jgi:hypothetical protein
MSIRVKNQAIPLYTDSETLFNNKTSRCEWHEDYYPVVTCEDVSEIVLNNQVYIENACVDSGFDNVINGTISNDGVSTVIIQDSSATFISDGVMAGWNLMAYTGGQDGTTNGANKIVSVDSETQVTVTLAFVPTEDQYYEISEWEYSGDSRAYNNYWEVRNTAPTTTDSRLGTNIKNNTIYKVEFTVSFIDPDAPASNIYVVLGTNEILRIFAEDIEATTYTAYGISNSTGFQIRVDGNPVISIDDVIISEMYTTSFSIKNCETDDTVYSSVFSDFGFSTKSDQLRMDIDWSNVMNNYGCLGCYYVDVINKADPDENLERISNGTFDSSTDWNVGSEWSISSGKAIIDTNIEAGELSQTSLARNFKKGLSYDVTLDVSNYAVGSCDISLYNGGVLVLFLGSFNSDGSKSFNTGILTNECDEIRFTVDGLNNTYSIDNVSALKNTTDNNFEYRTDCFEVTDELDCTIKLSGTNLDNAFGIDFSELNYNPFIRVKGELTTPKYDGDKENEEDSLGISKTLYFKSETKREMFLYQLPMFHHEFIRLLIGYDRFLVDDVEYISTDSSYEPESERILGKLPDLSNSTTELRLKDDLNENKFC